MASGFSGNPETTWLHLPGDQDRKMSLLADFTYIDWAGKPWVTPDACTVDGASIPRALWTLVGSPYTGLYRRASIVHDKACDDAVGDPAARKRADKMFYQACRDGGCSRWQAAVLYVGVRIGATFAHAGLMDERDEDLTPRLTEGPLDRDMRTALQNIADSPEVTAAATDHVPDEADAVDAAVVIAGRRHFAVTARMRGMPPLDWD